MGRGVIRQVPLDLDDTGRATSAGSVVGEDLSEQVARDRQRRARVERAREDATAAIDVVG
jgi:hypothetical protein